MKTSRFWKPVLMALVLTPFLLILGVASAGAGHGNYFLAKILFPFTMLSTVIFGSITNLFMILAVVQFPIYGIAFGIAKIKGKLLYLTTALGLLHLVAIGLCFLFPNENFT